MNPKTMIIPIVITYDVFLWNWNKSAICDNAIFIAFYLNETIGDEMWWLTIEEWATHGIHIPKI